MQDDHYEGALLEEIKSQHKAILELVGSMKDHVKHIPKIGDGINSLKRDMTTVKLVVGKTNLDVRELKRRVSHLETA